MRVLAIDFGLARLGLAVSDPTGTLASPYDVLHEKDMGRQITRVVEVIEALEVERVLVGIPYHADGSASEMTATVERYAAKLEAVTGLEVIRWDESFSSIEAERIMKASSVRGRKRSRLKGKVDKVAAAITLQSWLDRHR